MTAARGEERLWMHSREQIDALLYGGHHSPRFTQDSPVLPDVWIKYAEEPHRPHELLLTPYQHPSSGSVTAGQLSRVLKACLAVPEARRPAGPLRRVDGQRGPSVAYNQSTVLANLWFDELVRVVIPLSAWWHRLGEERRQSGADADTTPEERAARRRQKRAELLQTLRDAEWKARVVEALTDAASAPPELSPDLLWMAHIIGSIGLVWKHSQPGAAPPEPLWWPLQDDEVRKLSGEPDSRYAARLADHHSAVVDRVIDLTMGLEDAPWGVAGVPVDQPMLWSVSLNRLARSTMWRSRATVKADAAIRVFDITCGDLAWAVIDSGIDARHIAFRARKGSGERYKEWFENDKSRTRIKASYDFTVVRDLLSEDTLKATVEKLPAGSSAQEQHARKQYVAALQQRLIEGLEVDWDVVGRLIRIPHVEIEGNLRESYRPPAQEHGTHVAGILAGDCREKDTEDPVENTPVGMCPDLQLYDLRVLDANGQGDEFNVMAALQFVRHLNSLHEAVAVHGVNMSVSIRHDIANFACGRTPVCEECERLVGAGIVVVAAAGNDGYLQYLTPRGPQDSYRSISVTDPGNAAGVITVGSTHRFQPHTYGVSYFSSRGPTGDGRAKPDLVAPGEKIEAPVGGYMDVKRMDGTSMAAPHVSGAAALLIARHRELVGQPTRIKQVLCATATDLGRERYFQGAGLVDVLRALQSV